IAFGTVATIFRKKVDNYNGEFQYIEYEDIQNDRPYTFPIKKNRYSIISGESFSNIPGSPVAYWANNNIINSFSSNEAIETSLTFKKGMSTGNNARFMKN